MPDEPDTTARLQEREVPLASEEPGEQTQALPLPTDVPAEEPVTESAAAPEPVIEPVADTAAPAAVPAVKKAPARKAPAKNAAKKAPAKKAARKTAPPATARPVTPRAPRKAAAAAVAVPDLSARAAAGPWPVSEQPVAAPEPVAAPPVPAPRRGDPLVRFLVVLSVLLLAAAAGLGAAALVEHRGSSYRATTVVRLDPGPDPTLPIEQTLDAGVTTYTQSASTPEFTRTVAQRAQVAASAVDGSVQATRRAPRQLALAVSADSSATARALATAAGDAFVELVNLGEAGEQASPGDRLAAVVVSVGGATKTAPADRDAEVAGLLAAGAVLVLGGVASVIRLTRGT